MYFKMQFVEHFPIIFQVKGVSTENNETISSPRNNNNDKVEWGEKEDT